MQLARRSIAIISILMVTSVSVAQDTSDAQIIGPVRYAEEQVTVMFDPTVFSISAEMLGEIARSKDVAAAAATELTGEVVRLKPWKNSEGWTGEKTRTVFLASAFQPSGFRGQRTPGQFYHKVRVTVVGGG